MKNKINIAELLRKCPSGMELDCLIFEDVTLYNIDTNTENEYPIRLETRNGHFLDLTKYGTYSNVEEAKCVIFPKGKTTWEGFVPPCKFKDGDKIHLWTIQDAKDGDVIIYDDGWTCIFKHIHGIWYSSYCFITDGGEFHTGYETHAVDSTINGNAHLATKEQCNLFFQKIKDNGYNWNAKTKTLEKLPKFKVGNRIKKKGIDDIYAIEITAVTQTIYIFKNGGFQYVDSTDKNYELVPNK